jgi:thiamine-monophosphate kinase
MIIDAAAIPIEDAAMARLARDGRDPLATAITAGDDYELLFTVRPRLRSRLRTVMRQADTTITRIGVCTADREVRLRRGDRSEPMPLGFSHFR